MKRPAFWLLLAAISYYVTYCLMLSVEVKGARHSGLCDDAMITMTYAKNFVTGHGLQWGNNGHRVEGYSHPAWLAIMIIAHLVVGNMARTGFVVQLAAAIFLCLAALEAMKMARRLTHSSTASTASFLLVAFFFPLVYPSLLGLETSMQAYLMLLAVRFVDDILFLRRNREWALGVVLAVGYLVRMDFLVAAIVTIFCLLGLSGKRGWWQRVKNVMVILIPLAVAVAVYQVFRVSYFGDSLPNTYYLKLYKVPFEARILRGMAFSAKGVFAMLIPLAVLVISISGGFRRRKRLIPAVLLALSSVAYSIYIGGDFMEHTDQRFYGPNRFMAVGIALLFPASMTLVSDMACWIRRSRPLRSTLVSAVALAIFIVSNGIVDVDRLLFLTGVFQPIDHRAGTVEAIGSIARLNQVLKPGALVAVGGAGYYGYYSQYRLIDTLGYNDRHIAKQGTYECYDYHNFMSYRPGHAKVDYAYVIASNHPDFVIGVWGKPWSNLNTQVGNLFREYNYGIVQDRADWYFWQDSTNNLLLKKNQ